MLSTTQAVYDAALASDATPVATNATGSSGDAQTYARGNHRHALGAAASASDLAATTLGAGASLIGIYDVAENLTATNVEAAFAEIFASIGPIVDAATGAVPLASVQTGSATLVAGEAAVATATLTNGSVILPIRDVLGGTAGALTITAVTPGAPGTFTLTSASATDTSVVRWLVIG